MKINKRTLSGYIAILISVILLVLSYLTENMTILIISGILLVVSVLLLVILSSIELFTKDKELNIEELKKAGLTIVKCKICGENNVLEDKYCIFCGEKLVINDEKVQE